MARRLGNISRETIPLLILFVAQQKPFRGGLWHPILMQFYSGPLMQLLSGVDTGVREAIARGVIGFDAVKHLVLCRIERRPPRLDLTVYPYLPRATVAITSARAYLDLLTGASS